MIMTDLLPLSALLSSFSSSFSPLGGKDGPIVLSSGHKLSSWSTLGSLSPAQGLEIGSHWPSWSHMPMSDPWEPGKWTTLIVQV